MRKIVLFLLAAGFSTFGFAQEHRNCGSHEYHIQMMQSDPEYKANREKIEIQTREYEANPQKHSRAIKTIPVVFHIIYNTAAQNVSDAQVQSQLAVLNADFRKMNIDWTNTPLAFQGLVADCEVQFCLAQQNPAGTATTGINRVQTNVTSFSTNNAMKYTAQGGANAWDRNKYLNIWVCNLGGGVLGYAQFPGGAAATDGVVITYTAFGTMGTATAPFHKGRTATHEVGHWLNLYHIWGDDGTSCNGSDLVGDTPNQADENYGCPAFPQVSCNNGPNGDMYMNYMDYTNDACMYMFSNGQKVRMDALFAAGGARASLLTSPGCNPPVAVACGTPSGLNATGITTTTATLNWGAVANAVSYNVQYKLNNAAVWTTTTSATNSKALTGLTAGSVYQFQVQAVCASGSGSYSAIASFSTTAAGGGAACSNSYESNNTMGTAALISTNTNILSLIGTSSDKDYYRITTTNAAPKLKVTLSTLPFDYDLKLYNANGTLLGTSQYGGTTSELLKYNANTGGTYYIYVYGYAGAYSATNCYTLRASTSATNWRQEASGEDLESKPELNIYPNPANDKIAVQIFTEAHVTSTFNIYNALGQRVLSENYTSTNDGENNLFFNLGNLSNGIYIMEMINSDERKIQKFTIQK